MIKLPHTIVDPTKYSEINIHQAKEPDTVSRDDCNFWFRGCMSFIIASRTRQVCTLEQSKEGVTVSHLTYSLKCPHLAIWNRISYFWQALMLWKLEHVLYRQKILDDSDAHSGHYEEAGYHFFLPVRAFNVLILWLYSRFWIAG